MTDTTTVTESNEAAAAVEAEALLGKFLGEEGKETAPQEPAPEPEAEETEEAQTEPAAEEEKEESKEKKEEKPKKKKNNLVKILRSQVSEKNKQIKELDAKIKEMWTEDVEAYIDAKVDNRMAKNEVKELEVDEERRLYEDHPEAKDFKDQINQVKESLPDAGYEFIYRWLNPLAFVNEQEKAQEQARKTSVQGISPASLKKDTPEDLAAKALEEFKAMWY